MELLDSIPYSEQCSTPSEAIFLRQLYEIKLNKYQGPFPDPRSVKLGAITSPSPTLLSGTASSSSPIFKSKLILDTSQGSPDSLKQAPSLAEDCQPNLVIKLIPTNLDVLVSKAERLFYNCRFQSCLRLTEE